MSIVQNWGSLILLSSQRLIFRLPESPVKQFLNLSVAKLGIGMMTNHFISRSGIQLLSLFRGQQAPNPKGMLLLLSFSVKFHSLYVVMCGWSLLTEMFLNSIHFHFYPFSGPFLARSLHRFQVQSNTSHNHRFYAGYLEKYQGLNVHI